MDIHSRRKKLFELLGDVPDRTRDIQARKINDQLIDSYVLEELVLDLNGLEQVPAYFVKPANCEKELPTVIFNHSHGGQFHIGKTELVKSSDYLQSVSYAKQLTDLGYGVICIDAWGFGDRRGKSESELFKEMLWNGQVMWGMMVYDSMRVVDYLHTREDVDSTRLATVGMSMGGLMAWWLAALDERVGVCIDICAQVDADSLIRARGLDFHGLYSYVPKLLNYFQTADIQQCITPRPHLSLVGNHDRLTPVEGFLRIDEQLSKYYQEIGHSEKWKMLRFGCGHIETAEMRAEVCSFLQAYV
ncbi:dienelactone hydrolase family protein [Bacillus suaedae]|uniref:Prolyl oligopeptidase family serine peptidase n=1 Tax=Halalkalibacter suaedae TaxID=2822140 RepID=A0A940WSH0_9BACI|nr:alpha/beta fold hydrolase [Bacillus suaedae]MBP3950948.1 prolyl oligopeptidase family serine peptidase [Bacillus suaedae]